MNAILSTIQILITSFGSQYKCLLSHRDITKSCLLQGIRSRLVSIAPVWKISIHTLSSSSVGDNISYFRSLLYFSPHNLPSPLPFSVSPIVLVPSFFCWLSHLLYTDAFRLFTIDKPITVPNTISQHNPLHTRFISFVQHDKTLLLDINNTIVDSTYPVPEPPLISDYIIFDGWFGITYPDSHHTTYVCSPYTSESLQLYSLQTLSPLYSSLLSSFAIKYLVLHTLSPSLFRHVADMFLSTILKPPILPPVTHQIISSCFTLQPLQT